ncbi:MAG: FliM/FliN family flagellar motor switch protein [Planctomyces sp.]|nr:FliM/FliN family flagellar motor switch protein [Planctomyces sp.]
MISQPTIQAFDARSVRGLSTVSRRTVERWLKSCAARSTEVLTSLGIKATLAYESLSTREAPDAMAMLADPDAAAIFQVGGTRFPAVMSMRPGCLLALLHGMLGVDAEEWPADRNLTSVETSLSELLFDGLRREWSEAWPKRDPISISYSRTIARSPRARLFDPASGLIVVQFRVTCGCGEVPLHWVMPIDDVEHLTGPAAPATASRGTAGARLADVVPMVPLPLSVELGRVQLTVSEAESLRRGDVLMLDQTVRAPLTARVAGEAKYQGRAGRIGSRLCFAIDALVED